MLQTPKFTTTVNLSGLRRWAKGSQGRRRLCHRQMRPVQGWQERKMPRRHWIRQFREGQCPQGLRRKFNECHICTMEAKFNQTFLDYLFTKRTHQPLHYRHMPPSWRPRKPLRASKGELLWLLKSDTWRRWQHYCIDSWCALESLYCRTYFKDFMISSQFLFLKWG